MPSGKARPSSGAFGHHTSWRGFFGVGAKRFDLLASKRFAPSPKKPRHEVWWPKAPLDGRAFPEGIQPPEGDDSFNESARLTGFLNGVCGAEFYIANLSAPPPHFRHTGKLDAELAKWIRTRLVSNPTCLLASTIDVFLVFDSQLHYSVIGAPPEIIEKFEKRFGGAEACSGSSPTSSTSCISAAAWKT